MSVLNSDSKVTWCLFLVLLAHVQLVCQAKNATNVVTSEKPSNFSEDANPHDIDFETLSMFGVTHEFAEQFRINLIKAIEAAKDEVDPLRQGEFGGGGPGGVQESEEDEEEETAPATPGPGAFGVLSGLFGIFSGLGSLNPSRIIQSTVNFFPPGQRMQAQMIVDSLIGYQPPENRTMRPRPVRTRRPRTTTPMIITDAMMKEVTTEASTLNTTFASSSNGNGTQVVSKGETEVTSSVASPPEPEPTTTEGFVNVHEILRRSTTPEPPQNEDDETDLEKRLYGTSKPKSNSSIAAYKVKVKVQENVALETEENDAEMKFNATLPTTTEIVSEVTDKQVETKVSTEVPSAPSMSTESLAQSSISTEDTTVPQTTSTLTPTPSSSLPSV